MKTAIVYYSKHHENTLKLLRAIKEADPAVTLIDALEGGDLSGYDAIGFASGIYYSKFHKSVLRMAQQMPEGKKTFFLYTYGAKRDGYTGSIREATVGRHAQVLGEYGCYGFNTFGPLRLIGGMAKGRPNSEDIRGAVEFYANLFRRGD